MSSSPITLPLDTIVDVTVLVAPQAPQQPQFNQGLIVGSSAVIPSTQRVRQYNNVAQMLSDGFNSSAPEYIAASIYFEQSPAPALVWIGRLDLSAIFSLVPHAANEGTGYVVGDTVAIVQTGASGATAKVASVSGGGAVTGLTLQLQGTGYVVANGVATSGGTGTGLQVDITALGESPLQALTACRAASFAWYAAMSTVGATADHEAIAAYIESATPVATYFFATADANVPTNGSGNVFSVLKALKYSRTFGVYSTTQGGAFPNNIYAAAATMGVAMGLNTGLDNSFFTMMFKSLVGISTEPLSPTSIGNIQGNNGNIYLDYGNAYLILGQGVVPSGQYYDEILNLDVLRSDIQFSCMNLLVDNPSIPQTDPGQTQLIHAVNEACDRAKARGFIAPGTWGGVQIINLKSGDSVPNGYVCQSYPYSTQAKSDRQARKAMPIYCAIIEAGAVQFILIGVYVQR